jgi:hypothetical protein
MSSPRAGIPSISSSRRAERHGRTVPGCSARNTGTPGGDFFSSILISDDESGEQNVRNPGCKSDLFFNALHDTGPHFSKAMYCLTQQFSPQGHGAGLDLCQSTFPASPP